MELLGQVSRDRASVVLEVSYQTRLLETMKVKRTTTDLVCKYLAIARR